MISESSIFDDVTQRSQFCEGVAKTFKLTSYEELAATAKVVAAGHRYNVIAGSNSQITACEELAEGLILSKGKNQSMRTVGAYLTNTQKALPLLDLAIKNSLLYHSIYLGATAALHEGLRAESYHAAITPQAVERIWPSGELILLFTEVASFLTIGSILKEPMNPMETEQANGKLSSAEKILDQMVLEPSPVHIPKPETVMAILQGELGQVGKDASGRILAIMNKQRAGDLRH